MKGRMAGELKSLETDSSEDEEDESDVTIEQVQKQQQQQSVKRAGAQKTKQTNKKKSSGFSILSNLKSLVGSKALTHEDVAPVLEKMRDHLIGAQNIAQVLLIPSLLLTLSFSGKNVAADIADQLCASVATKLEGKVLGTFESE